MIPETLILPINNLIATNYSPEEIDLIGCQLEPRFNSHFHSGEPFGITLRPAQAAKSLVTYFQKKGMLDKLIPVLIRTENDISIIDRTLKLEGLNDFLQKLSNAGLAYDSGSNTIIEARREDDLVSWGYLKEGETYDFAFLSVDIVGNSEIQKKYPKEDIELVYSNLLSFLQSNITKYKGKIWSWAGDGGLVAFHLGNPSRDSVRCAVNIYLGMVLFNLSPKQNKFKEPIRLRIASHEGAASYREDKGKILSEAINYVAHLEKKGTPTNGIAISSSVYNLLDPRLKQIFIRDDKPFENIIVYRVDMNLPGM